MNEIQFFRYVQYVDQLGQAHLDGAELTRSTVTGTGSDDKGYEIRYVLYQEGREIHYRYEMTDYNDYVRGHPYVLVEKYDERGLYAVLKWEEMVGRAFHEEMDLEILLEA